MIKVNLHFEGPGFAPFDAQETMASSPARMQIINSHHLVALVDPATQKYEIDWGASALIAGTVPAQFTSTSDNRTYDLRGQIGPLMQILQILRANGIAADHVVDLRSNPVAREQVMAVVRQAAGAQPTAAPPAAPVAPPMPAPFLGAPPEPTTAQRLQELETLRATGTITEAEYATKRQQILSEL